LEIEEEKVKDREKERDVWLLFFDSDRRARSAVEKRGREREVRKRDMIERKCRACKSPRGFWIFSLLLLFSLQTRCLFSFLFFSTFSASLSTTKRIGWNNTEPAFFLGHPLSLSRFHPCSSLPLSSLSPIRQANEII
jgi:hypothetical protein